jgi:hypothetical protein
MSTCRCNSSLRALLSAPRAQTEHAMGDFANQATARLELHVRCQGGLGSAHAVWSKAFLEGQRKMLSISAKGRGGARHV